MSDVITVSSDEEEIYESPKKRFKPDYLGHKFENDSVARSSDPSKKRIKPILVENTLENDAVVLTSSDDEEQNESRNYKSPTGSSMENLSIQNGLSRNSPGESAEGISTSKEKLENSVAGNIIDIQDDEVVGEICKDDSEDSIDVPARQSRTDSYEMPLSSNGAGAETSDAHPFKVLQTFIDVWLSSIKGSKYEALGSRVPVIKNLFKKYICCNNYNDEIESLLQEKTNKAKESAVEAVLSFNDIIEHLNSSLVQDAIEVKPEHRKKVKLLLQTCLKLIKRIKRLENSEVDWDEDCDSAYLQEDRYKERLVKVFSCYCKYVKMNPHAGRITHQKLDFVASKYDVINLAINKKHKNGTNFPTYADIEKIVRECDACHQLNMTENCIKKESESCFKSLGNLLQKRRKHELYQSHYNFIKDGSDPASVDGQLDRVLKDNFSEGVKKIEAVCEQYVQKQMNGAEIELSEDSDDSNHDCSDD